MSDFDKPTRDELLDAYDVVIRDAPQSLRAKLDVVYECGFEAGVRAMRDQIARQKAADE